MRPAPWLAACIATLLGGCSSDGGPAGAGETGSSGPAATSATEVASGPQTPTGDASSTGSTGADGSTTREPTGTTGTTGPDPACAELRTALEGVAADYRDARQLVGLSIAVSSAGCEPWTQAWGDADLSASAELTTEHLLRAGSVTKSYTAGLVLKLADADALALDDTLEAWGFTIPSADEITVTQLLNHTSGLADYQNNPDFRAAAAADPDRVWAPSELIDYTVELGPVGAPGATHNYSNANYILAGLIAEQASGETYAQALREHVLDPLGLEHTYVEADDTWTDPMATGYLVIADNPPEDTSGQYHASWAWTSGAVVATPDDMRAWMDGLLATDFLEPASQAALVDFVPTVGTEGYGLGVFAIANGDVSAVGHDGAVLGFQAAAFHQPATDTTVAVMQNQITLNNAGAISSTPIELALQLFAAAADG